MAKGRWFCKNASAPRAITWFKSPRFMVLDNTARGIAVLSFRFRSWITLLPSKVGTFRTDEIDLDKLAFNYSCPIWTINNFLSFSKVTSCKSSSEKAPLSINASSGHFLQLNLMPSIKPIFYSANTFLLVSQ